MTTCVFRNYLKSLGRIVDFGAKMGNIGFKRQKIPNQAFERTARSAVENRYVFTCCQVHGTCTAFLAAPQLNVKIATSKLWVPRRFPNCRCLLYLRLEEQSLIVNTSPCNILKFLSITVLPNTAVFVYGA